MEVEIDFGLWKKGERGRHLLVSIKAVYLMKFTLSLLRCKKTGRSCEYPSSMKACLCPLPDVVRVEFIWNIS